MSVSGVQKIIANHDIHKIMFGSDMPWEAPSETKRFLEQISLPDEQKRLIYGENALRFISM